LAGRLDDSEWTPDDDDAESEWQEEEDEDETIPARTAASIDIEGAEQCLIAASISRKKTPNAAEAPLDYRRRLLCLAIVHVDVDGMKHRAGRNTNHH
jgi:hypothetical protein